jgi:mersacidin/lichenicidin family type 2 lantibiotic
MSNLNLIRAGQNSDELRSQLPENLAGIIELSDANMESITGGAFDPLSFKSQLGLQSTTQGNVANIGGPGSVTIGSPIVQSQIAISTQNFFSF